MQSMGQLGILIGFMNLVALLFLLSTGAEFQYWMQVHGLPLPAWFPFAGAAVAIAVALLLTHKVGVPSAFAFWNQQWWLHNNFLRKYLEEREEKLDNRLSSIEEQLKRINAREERASGVLSGGNHPGQLPPAKAGGLQDES